VGVKLGLNYKKGDTDASINFNFVLTFDKPNDGFNTAFVTEF
jgi:hypothetical protein